MVAVERSSRLLELNDVSPLHSQTSISQYRSVCGSSVAWSITSSSPLFLFHLTYPSPGPSVIPLSSGKTEFKREGEVRGGRGWGGDVKETCSIIRKSQTGSCSYSCVFHCLWWQTRSCEWMQTSWIETSFQETGLFFPRRAESGLNAGSLAWPTEVTSLCP